MSGFELNIKSDIKQLERDLGRISKDVIPYAIPRALNRAGGSVNTAIKRSIAKRTSMKVKDVAKGTRVSKATRQIWNFRIDTTRARARNLIDWVTPKQAQPGSRGEPQYFRRKKKRRVKRGGRSAYLRKGVKARAWGVSTEYKGAFIAQVENGRVLVLARKGKNRRAKLKGLVGPSVRAVFSRDASRDLMRSVARQRLEVELPRQVQFYLRRALNRR